MGYRNAHNGPNGFLKSEKQHWTILITTWMYKIDSQWQSAIGRREPKAGTPWQPRGVGRGRRWMASTRGREHMYTSGWFIWQKLSQYCKVIILQLKLKYKLKTRVSPLWSQGDIIEKNHQRDIIFFWLWIWTMGVECQGMWGASRRFKKKKKGNGFWDLYQFFVLPNCVMINLHCFRQLSLWQFVTVAMENIQ